MTDNRIKYWSVFERMGEMANELGLNAVFFNIIAILLVGCAQQHQTSFRKRPTFIVSQYRISPNDSMEITFSDEPQLTQQVRVSWDGKINLSYLNLNGKAELAAAGKTPVELIAAINQLAKVNGILISPLANVRIVDYADQAFVVYGQVNNPGRFLFPKGYPPRMSILEAIAVSGGFTRLARPSHVLVKRGEEVVRLDLKSMAAEPGAMQLEIQPGDVITVPERIL